MVKVVIEDFVAVLCVLHGEVVAGTDKEKVPHDVSYHLLVEISIVNMLPVCVLTNIHSVIC